jgi:hypothetical protein
VVRAGKPGLTQGRRGTPEAETTSAFVKVLPTAGCSMPEQLIRLEPAIVESSLSAFAASHYMRRCVIY